MIYNKKFEITDTKAIIYKEVNKKITAYKNGNLENTAKHKILLIKLQF